MQEHDRAGLGVGEELKASGDTLNDLADLFKIFGDRTRVRILFALSKGAKNVTQIADDLDMTRSAISHQLRTLKQAKLVKYERDGKTLYYSLDDDHVTTILNQGLAHVLE